MDLPFCFCSGPKRRSSRFSRVVDAGDAQDPEGKTGLAHMMEHMAFKGTDEIGTTNYPGGKSGSGEGGDDLRGV